MNGEINISDLEPGVYSVVEMDAPEGYVKEHHEYHVELFPRPDQRVGGIQ